MTTRRWFVGLVCLSLMVVVTACTEVDAAQSPLQTSEGTPTVQADHATNAQPSEETGDDGIDLISGYLRQAVSPEHFLENFSAALKARNGAVARLFLKPELRYEIKPQVIGVSTQLKKIEITPIDSKQYKLTAYFAPYGDKPELLAFEWKATVEPERPDLAGKGGQYFITSLECLQDATGNAWGSPPDSSLTTEKLISQKWETVSNPVRVQGKITKVDATEDGKFAAISLNVTENLHYANQHYEYDYVGDTIDLYIKGDSANPDILGKLEEGTMLAVTFSQVALPDGKVFYGTDWREGYTWLRTISISLMTEKR